VCERGWELGLKSTCFIGSRAGGADFRISPSELSDLGHRFRESLQVASLNRQVAELQSRVHALESARESQMAATRRREAEIYGEMRRAGFGPDDAEDDLDPGVPEEVWEAVLNEV